MGRREREAQGKRREKTEEQGRAWGRLVRQERWPDLDEQTRQCRRNHLEKQNGTGRI